MRNIFDQYTQPENRVTHALMTALDRDRKLLARFLIDLVKADHQFDASKLRLLEQRYPGEDEERNEDEAERRGIPDGWIFDDDRDWCFVIESKVLIDLKREQIDRHRRTASRRGFTKVTLIAITPRKPRFSPPPETRFLEWQEIYVWLHTRVSTSEWAAAACEYLERAEALLIGTGQFREGTLTKFAGIPFGAERPFTYLEGKRILGLALQQLRRSSRLRKELGMNPNVPGRPAITGKDAESVWDFLSLARNAGDAFTDYPHLTLGIGSRIEAMVTVPHAVNRGLMRQLRILGADGFKTLVREVLNNLTPLLNSEPGARPTFRGVQRRYRSQRAKPEVDATVDFDLRTAFPDSGPPKGQPRWLEAGYGALTDKRRSNYQVQLGVVFHYGTSDRLRSANAIGLIEESWLACQPLTNLIRQI